MYLPLHFKPPFPFILTLIYDILSVSNLKSESESQSIASYSSSLVTMILYTFFFKLLIFEKKLIWKKFLAMVGNGELGFFFL